MKEQTYPGLKRSEVLELLPELQIDEEQAKILDEEGWFKLGHVETTEEVKARAKEVLRMFKEMAKDESKQGKTIFAVSHGLFLCRLIEKFLPSYD